MIEDRLIDLEIRLAFQDDQLQALNLCVARQQDEIDALRRGLESVQQRFGELISGGSTEPLSE